MSAMVVALLLSVTNAFAQETVPLEQWTLPMPDPLSAGSIGAPELPISPSVSAEQRYVFIFRHFARLFIDSTTNPITVIDSNLMNFYVPISLGDNQQGNPVEVRGIGEMFAPGVINEFFKPHYSSADADNMVYDSTMYQQFAGAQSYTIDTIVTRYFKNPNGGFLTAPGKFYIWRTPPTFPGNSYFRGASYQTNGFVAGRSTMVEVAGGELTEEGLDSTLNLDQINEVYHAFDPPLEFPAGSAAIAMYLNDDAVAVDTPRIAAWHTEDFQVVRGFFANIEGTRRPPNYKTMGVVVYRTVIGGNPVDTVATAWSVLNYGAGNPANLDMFFIFAGTVDLQSGVKYHYGRDAGHQGITAVTPNPARESSRVSFELLNVSSVTLDLFNAEGEKVRSLVDARYIPGIYSYDLKVTDLQNGTYVVRLQTGDQVYTHKINVVK